MFLRACRALRASDVSRFFFFFFFFFFFLLPPLCVDLLETSNKLAVRLQNVSIHGVSERHADVPRCLNL